MNKRLNRRRHFYYPLVRRIYNELEDDLLWVGVKSFAFEDYIKTDWIFDCINTSFIGKSRHYNKCNKFLNNNDDKFLRLTDLLFNNPDLNVSVFIIYKEEDNFIEIIEDEDNLITFNLSNPFYTKIFNDFNNLDDIINPQKDKIIAEFTKKIRVSFSNQIKILNISNEELNKLSRFLIWLKIHDNNASGFLYTPYDADKGSNNHSKNKDLGGYILAINTKKKVEYKSYKIFKELFHISYDLDSIFHTIIPNYKSRYLNYKNVLNIFGTSIIIKEYLKKNFNEYSKNIRNFSIQENHDDLIQKEESIIFSPILSILSLMEDTRWFSVFGWHEIQKSLYRIGYDVIPDTEKRINWKTIIQRRNQFTYFAAHFNDYVDNDKIISLGDIIFTKSFNKKALIILFDKDKEDIRNSIETNLNFLLSDNSPFSFLSFKALYSDIIDDINKSIEDIDFNNELDFKEFISKIDSKNIGHSNSVRSLLENDFIKDLDDIKPNFKIHNDEFKDKVYHYLCWLIGHDTKTKYIVYFPSTSIPYLPSGGLMVGFDKLPNLNNLLSLKELIDSFFMIKSYLLSELVPHFPNILSKVSFERKFNQIRVENKGVNNGSFAFLDVDKLHSFNTQFGHYGGTLAIRVVIRSIIESLKKYKHSDYLIGQWGGDEFVLYINECKKSKMKEMLEYARENVLKGVFLKDEFKVFKSEKSSDISETTFDDIEKNLNNMKSRISFSSSYVDYTDVNDFSDMEPLCDKIIMKFKEPKKNNQNIGKSAIRGFIAGKNDFDNSDEFIKSYLDSLENEYLKEINSPNSSSR